MLIFHCLGGGTALAEWLAVIDFSGAEQPAAGLAVAGHAVPGPSEWSRDDPVPEKEARRGRRGSKNRTQSCQSNETMVYLFYSPKRAYKGQFWRNLWENASKTPKIRYFCPKLAIFRLCRGLGCQDRRFEPAQPLQEAERPCQQNSPQLVWLVPGTLCPASEWSRDALVPES